MRLSVLLGFSLKELLVSKGAAQSGEARWRANHIIAALTERIPELEAPPQSAQEAESVAESVAEGESGEEAAEKRTEPQSPESQERVPWWRRIFGLGR